MSTNAIVNNENPARTLTADGRLFVMQQQIEQLGFLPFEPYVSAIHMRRNSTGEHWRGTIEVKGQVVKEGEYNNYFLNYRGKLQCRGDVYHFRWTEGELPELVGYYIYCGNKSWQKPNPKNKYITFK